MVGGIEWLVVTEMDEFVLTYNEPGYYLCDVLRAYDRGGANVVCTFIRHSTPRARIDMPSALPHHNCA